MNRIILLLAALLLTGCATWNEMSPTKKTAVVVGAIVVVALVASSSDSYSNSDPNEQCRIDCGY